LPINELLNGSAKRDVSVQQPTLLKKPAAGGIQAQAAFLITHFNFSA
jgi:hypothetical protein